MDNSGLDDFYAGFEVELGAHNEYNKPIRKKEPEPSGLEPWQIEARIRMMAQYFDV